ncbi:WD domain, G-beta repeat protein, partial [Opisthorchis viverrini]
IPRAKSTSRLFVPSNDSVVNGLDHNSSLGSPLTAQSSQVSCPRAHSVTDVTWSCADNVLATGSSNGAITLWEVGSAITQRRTLANPTPVHHLELSFNARLYLAQFEMSPTALVTVICLLQLKRMAHCPSGTLVNLVVHTLPSRDTPVP